MSKPTKKRTNFNDDAITILKERYDYSKDYIRKCLRGDRVGVMADVIKKEYSKLVKASKSAIEAESKNLTP